MADETVYIRGESGAVIEHSLPLPSGIQDRLDRGHLQQVEADGGPLKAEKPKPAPRGAAKSDAK